MQEDANRRVPPQDSRIVTNASTASARDQDTRSGANMLVMLGAGLILLVILATLLT